MEGESPGRTRADRIAPWAIFGTALAVRLVYFAEIADMPLVVTPIVDARAYDEWAQRIAAGAWWGTEVFYQAPLYPYWLAVQYALFGRDLVLVHGIQMAMGAGACVLLAAAARALFGRAEGVVAGFMLALYPPAIFFDGLIGKQCLGMLLLTGLLALLFGHQRAPARWRCGAAGVLLALLALTRENALLLAPAIPLWLLWRPRSRPAGARVADAVVFVAAVASLLVSVGLRNLAVGDTFALTTSQLGPNFYMGNHEHATGLYVPLVPGRQTPVYEAPDAEALAERALGRPLTRGEVSDWWLARGLEFVREHPGRWAMLMLRKTLLTWHAVEIADVEDLQVYDDWSRLLRVLAPFWGFGWLVPLAAAGVVLAWDRRRDLVLPLGGMAIYTLSVALFITFARFRYPLVAFLVPLAAHAVVRGRALIAAGDHAALGRPLLALALAGLLVRVPLVDEDLLLMSGYANLGGVLLAEGRLDEAEPHLRRAMALDPRSADLHFRMAVLAYERGRLESAADQLGTMMSLEPRDPRGPRLLAHIRARQGRSDEARALRARARRLDPGSPEDARPGAARGP